MQKLLILAMALVSYLPVTAAQPQAAPGGVQRLPANQPTGAAASVRVPDGALVWTGQIFATKLDGDARAQCDATLAALDGVLAKADSSLANVVRLTAYVADDAAVAAVDAIVAERWARAPVAFSLVRTPVASIGARVAFEAVATTSRVAPAVEVGEGAAVLPAGAKIFISGQAEKEADVAAAVRATMAGLHRSVAHLGLKKSDVVQVKAFIRPFADHAAAQREVVASFDGAAVPPVVLMEWQSELFAEIEIVVSAKALAAPAGDTVSYAWLPWLTKSPRYCHVVHVASGTPLIFVGAVQGDDAGDARGQMKTIFERLGSVLFEAGSSYRNLVKATYYLGDPKARAVLGDIRGVYFDPTRPPAASALGVAGFGRPGRAAAVEMIAVPVK